MYQINTFLANSFVRWFRRIGICGHTRFWITRIGYKLLWKTAPRNGEWDFILQYLPTLEHWQRGRGPTVLDFGCAESLLIYELLARGYDVRGADQRPYQEKPKFEFYQWDILLGDLVSWIDYDYIISVSVIEHIGIGAYGDTKGEEGDRIALQRLHKLLKSDGKLIITVPNQWWKNDNGRGYTYKQFMNLIFGLFNIYELTERNGQICTVLVKL